MPYIIEANPDVLVKGNELVIFDAGEILEGFCRIHSRIKRAGIRQPCPSLLAVFPLDLRLLNVSTVWQHDRTQLFCCAGSDNLPLESLLDNQRNEPTVVDMGMGEQQIVDLFGVK